MRGADVARVARSHPPPPLVAHLYAPYAPPRSCASTPSTMIAAGKLIDREASPEPSTKPATPRISVDDRRKSCSIQWSWNGQGLIARCWISSKRLSLIRNFAIRNDGVVRLNLEMARMVMAKFLHEKTSTPTGGVDVKRTFQPGG